MNVLSLFDGISCARVSLGDRVKTYYASEVDKYAIQIAKKNYADTIHIGDVRTITKDIFTEPIDLLIGGSPCQDLSIAKKGRKGLDGERSGLFWEYVRLKDELKPKWFILENVASMSKEAKRIITEAMGVEPVMINAALVSAQSRKRLFWTNIPIQGLPMDRGILLKDILEPETEVDERFITKSIKSFCLTTTYGKASTSERDVGTIKLGYIGNTDRQGLRVYSVEGKAPTQCKGSSVGGPLPSMIKIDRDVDERFFQKSIKTYTPSTSNSNCIGHINNSEGQGSRVYSIEGKSVTLSANGGGGGAKTGLYSVGRDIGRRLKDGKRCDDDKTIPIQRRIELRTDDKSGTLTSITKDNLVVSPLTIRKLTPIECERLQSLPDNYTEGISMTQRYRCLGNAFNVEVIKFILSFLPV